MAFDPITFTEVVNSKAPVGSVVRVISTFTSDKHVDAGAQFDGNEFPELAQQVQGGFQGDYFSEVPIIASPAVTSPPTVGTIIAAWADGTSYYFMFGGGTGSVAYTIWRTKSAKDLSSGLEFVRNYSQPGGVATTAILVSVDGNLLYTSSTLGHYRYNVSTDGLLQSPQTITMTGATAESAGKRLYFASGNGFLIANTGQALSVANNLFISSNDGAAWSVGPLVAALTSGANCPLAFGAGAFVFVTSATTGANWGRTTNGTTWTSGLMASSAGHNAVKWNAGANLFCTTPFNAGAAYTSPDGTTWTTRTLAPTSGLARIRCTTVGGAILCGVSDQSSYPFSVTANGTTFVNRTTTAPFSNVGNNPYRSVVGAEALDNNMIIFTYGYNTSPYRGQLLYSFSTDQGTTWSNAIPFSSISNKMVYRPPVVSTDGTRIVLMEYTVNNNPGPVMVWNGIASTNSGATWNQISITSGADIPIWMQMVATPTNGFYAMGQLPNNTAASQFPVQATSPDGITWTYRNVSAQAATQPLNVTVMQDGGIFIASASGSFGYFSADNGQTWASRSTAGLTGVRMYTFKDKLILTTDGAFGSQQPRYSTNNGVAWSTGQMTLIAAAVPGSFAADANVGVLTIVNSSTYFRTYDGVTWITGTLPSPMPGPGAAIINGWVMIPTGAGSAYRTNDFLSWELVVIGEDPKYQSMALTNIVNSGDNKDGVAHGPDASATAGYILSAVTEDTGKYRVPSMAADVSNTKWVVIAK